MGPPGPVLLRKWWWLPALAVGLAAATAAVAVRGAAPAHRARATLLAGAALDDPHAGPEDMDLGARLARVYADLGRREAVRAAAAAALGLPALPPVTVRAVADTQLVEVEALDTDPERARRVAGAVAAELLRLAPAGPDPRRAFLERQRQALEARIARLEAEAAGEGERGVEELSRLRAAYAALLGAGRGAVSNGLRLVEPPALVGAPSPAARGAAVLLAAGVALAAALGAVWLLEAFDDALRTPADLRRALGLATLGAIPDAPGVGPGPGPAGAEAYRGAAAALDVAAAGARRILVAGPEPGVGASTTAAGLAAALARLGSRVLVVDADLARPRQHALLGVAPEPGLAAVLRGGAAEPTASPRAAGVRVLPAGAAGAAPGLPAVVPLRAALDRLPEDEERALVDGPPVGAGADALLLAAASDGVVLVVECGRTTAPAARRALDALAGVRAPVLGAVLNRVAPRRSNYYYAG
jgi:non-specific protein-tyrosine kinase